jgi:hypothetical protein
MVNAANSNGNSHFLDVPLGVAQITDILIASPIINEGMDNGMGDANVGAGAQLEECLPIQLLASLLNMEE